MSEHYENSFRPKFIIQTSIMFLNVTKEMHQFVCFVTVVVTIIRMIQSLNKKKSLKL